MITLKSIEIKIKNFFFKLKDKNFRKGISTLIGASCLNFLVGAIFSLCTLSVYEASYINAKGGSIKIEHLTFYYPLEIIFQCLSEFLSGKMYKELGLHLTNLIGVTILTFGYFMMFISSSLLLDLISMILGGIGTGIIFYPSTLNAYEWFKDHNGLIVGIMETMISFGSFFFSFIGEKIINNDETPSNDIDNLYDFAIAKKIKLYLIIQMISLDTAFIISYFLMYEKEEEDLLKDLEENTQIIRFETQTDIGNIINDNENKDLVEKDIEVKINERKNNDIFDKDDSDKEIEDTNETIYKGSFEEKKEEKRIDGKDNIINDESEKEKDIKIIIKGELINNCQNEKYLETDIKEGKDNEKKTKNKIEELNNDKKEEKEIIEKDKIEKREKNVEDEKNKEEKNEENNEKENNKKKEEEKNEKTEKDSNFIKNEEIIKKNEEIKEEQNDSCETKKKKDENNNDENKINEDANNKILDLGDLEENEIKLKKDEDKEIINNNECNLKDEKKEPLISKNIEKDNENKFERRDDKKKLKLALKSKRLLLFCAIVILQSPVSNMAFSLYREIGEYEDIDVKYLQLVGSLYFIFECLSSFVFGLFCDYVQLKYLLFFINCVGTIVGFTYCLTFRSGLVFFLVQNLLSFSAGGYYPVKDCFLLKVFGKDVYIELSGYVSFLVSVAVNLLAPISYFVQSSLDEKNIAYWILFLSFGTLNLIGLILNFFIKETPIDLTKIAEK